MKVIIPASGKGTRMRSITNSKPKELVEIAGKPLIYYAIEECLRAGIDDIIVVISKNKLEIKEYVDNYITVQKDSYGSGELKAANVSVVIQEQANGSGGSVLAAENLICDEDFAVLFPDVYVDEKQSNIKEMIELFKLYNSPIILVDNIEMKDFDRYGITMTTNPKQNHYIVEKIFEKPSVIETGLTFHGIIGRYIFNNSFLKTIKRAGKNSKGEIDLTEGILLADKKIAKVIEGQHYECGTAEWYLKSKTILEEKIKDLEQVALRR